MRLVVRARDPHKPDVQLILALSLLLAGLYALGLAIWAPPFLHCPFHDLTGLPCPSCGATRAARALLAGDPVKAFLYNPGLWFAGAVAAGYACYTIAASVCGWRRLHLEMRPGDRRRLALLLGAAFLLNWIYLIVAGV